MTTIHLDAGAARDVLKELEKLADSLERIAQVTNTTVLGTAEHWRSTSANQFFSQYTGSIGTITGVAGEIRDIAVELATEITYWESVADRLSS